MEKELLGRLDALAAKLGVTAQYLWSVLLAQARVEIIATTVKCGLLVAAMAAMVLLARYGFKKSAVAGMWDGEEWTVLWIVSLIVALVCFFVLLSGVSELLTLTRNPEFWALKQVTEAIAK